MSEILSLIDAREYYSKQHNKCPCDYHLAKKKEAQHMVQRMKNNLKKQYVGTCLEKYKNDP